jgi:hypothetical protein
MHTVLEVFTIFGSDVRGKIFGKDSMESQSVDVSVLDADVYGAEFFIFA